MAEASGILSNIRGRRPGQSQGSSTSDRAELYYLIDQLDDTSQRLYLTQNPNEKTYYERIINQLEKRIAQLQMVGEGVGLSINDKRADQLSSAEVSDLSSDPKKLAQYFESRLEAIGKNPLAIKDEFMAFLKAAPKIAKNPDFLIAVGKSVPLIAPYILPYAYALKYKKYVLIAVVALGILLGFMVWSIYQFWQEDKLALIQEMINEPECEDVGNYFIGGDTNMDRCVITLMKNRIRSRVGALQEETP